MKLLWRLTNWMQKRGWLAKRYDASGIDKEKLVSPGEKILCTHGKMEMGAEYIVLGRKIGLMHSPMCHFCTTQYLNRFSTLCATCLEPILPGTHVGLAWTGALHPFTHLTFGCCETAGLYCGLWGEGRLVTLAEINPQKYDKGATTVLGQVFSSGKAVTDVLP